MGNKPSRITVSSTDEFSEDLKTLYIELLLGSVLRKIEINDSVFGLLITDIIIVTYTNGKKSEFKIKDIKPIIPALLDRLPTRELWSYTVEINELREKIYVFRKIFNSTKTSEISVIPTHIADQTMRAAIEKGDQCPIQFAPLTEETVVLTSCGHLFSKEGLSTWFQTRSLLEHNCPTCSKHVQKVHSLSQSS